MITKDTDKKLFLLDAFALIYRAYFAFAKNPRINSKGQNTSAAFGFTTALLDIINKEKPTHLAVVFDAPVATNRELEYTNYKANREEMPEDIRNMLEPIKEIIRAFNIPILLREGFEADDVIGTLAKRAEINGFTTYMMTPDKDFGQLVSENIFMYKPGRFGKGPEILGVPEVCEKFEVDHPLKVIDILGLWGDAVDNIPGIPGIGEKTAKKLIGQYGSVEGLIEHAEELKGKQKENVINFADQGRMSKMLATIITDVDVEFDEESLILEEPDPDKVKAIFTELEFRNLSKRVLGEEIVVPTKTVSSSPTAQLDMFANPEAALVPDSIQEEVATFETGKKNYRLVQSDAEINNLVEKLAKESSICFDTETTSIESLEAKLVGIAFATKKDEAYYVATPHQDDAKVKLILDKFQPIFSDEKKELIAHNAKYDIKVLMNYGVQIKGKIWDTMVAHYLIQPESKHSMDYLAELYLNYKPISIETLIGKKGKDQRSMGDLPPEQVYEYACEDADITLQLKAIFEPEIEKDHLKNLFYNIETPLIQVLAKMETEGINLDTAFLRQYSVELEKDLTQLHAAILEMAGEEFNVDSPKQLGVVLFDNMKITDKAKKTKTGQYSTSEDVLAKLENEHPIVPKILSYRKLKKLKSTYVDALPELVLQDGRIHTHYMQTVTATGRLSSNNPNLQNIPIRSEEGREIRKAFIPRNENFTLMASDYSQIELRIIAALSGDENMIQAFKSGHDIHSATAAKVFGVDIKEVTREDRSKAKAVNFGIVYGQSAFGLSQQLGIKRGEAKEIIDSYYAQYPKIKEFMHQYVELAKEQGYVETIMKRRRYLKDINSANAVVRGFAERNAINAPIQGSAADIIKIAMIKVQDAMEKANLKSKMLLQVHDELVFDVHKEEIDQMKKLVKENMENAVELVVPMETEMEVGANWLDAH
ncbi:MAG: DNA polymerase I [Crocinitomicaceae bacterium]|nr:DNA polymerase I [Crocinitomicaceae bacterium]